MSESAPPPKKSNTGLVLLGVFLLLGAGGAVAWKLSQGSKEEVVEETLPTSAPTVESTLDNAPPPPPPEEEVVEAEAAPQATGTKPSGPAGCSGACSGSAGAELQSSLRARGGQARGCYERSLRVNSTLAGKMTVSLKLSPTGAVCSASVSGDTLGDPAVTSCVLQNFRSGKYPAPTGGCVETAVPLNFVAK